MSEQRALAALQAWIGKPEWITGFARSTEEEDLYQGVDIWVETTDVGQLPIQVKSSEGNRIKFEQEGVKRGCAPGYQPYVVVVRPDIPDEIICRAVLNGCRHLRELRLSEGCKKSA